MKMDFLPKIVYIPDSFFELSHKRLVLTACDIEFLNRYFECLDSYLRSYSQIPLVVAVNVSLKKKEDDIQKIKQTKENFEDLDVEKIIKKYNTKNYVFAFMQKQNNKLSVYLKTNFNNNKVGKNLSYKIDDMKNIPREN